MHMGNSPKTGNQPERTLSDEIRRSDVVTDVRVNTEPEIRIPEILQAIFIFSEKPPTVDLSRRKSDGNVARAGWLKKIAECNLVGRSLRYHANTPCRAGAGHRDWGTWERL
jgi:hypothetical protein